LYLPYEVKKPFANLWRLYYNLKSPFEWHC
jgi:hypothetical protein